MKDTLVKPRNRNLLPPNRTGRQAIALIVGTLLITIGGGLVGGIAHVPIQNIPLLLSTLAGAQAALFGIVFAITILSIRLTTNRYSPRMVSLFIDGWLFKTTFFVFVVSIGFDILLLSQASMTPTRFLTAGVTAAGALALASTVILYWFVRTTLAQSTPEGLIDAVEDDLPPLRYITTCHEAANNGEIHPLHRLYSLILAALSHGESETAYRGMCTLDQITSKGLGHAHRKTATDTQIKTGFEIVLGEYIPEIVLHAYKTDERRTATSAIDTLDKLGQSGLRGDLEAVSEYSGEGLSKILKQPPTVTEANVVRGPAAEALADLLETSVSKSEYSTYSTLFIKLDGGLNVLLRRNADRWVYQDIFLEYVDGDLPSLFKQLIEHHEAQVNDGTIDWHQPYQQNKEPLSDSAKWFTLYHRRLKGITEGILRYIYRNEEYPFTSGNFSNAWRRIVTEATRSSLHSYAVLLSQTHIATAYYVDQLEGGSVGLWANQVASIMEAGDANVVQEAFEQLKQNEYSDHRLVSIYIHSEGEEKEMRGPLHRLLHDSTASEISFEDWLPQFEEKVLVRYNGN